MSSSATEVAERDLLGAVAGETLGVAPAVLGRHAPDPTAGRLPAARKIDAGNDAADNRRRETVRAAASRVGAAVAPRLAPLQAKVAQAAALELARGTALAFVPVFLAVGAFGYFLAATEPSLWTLLSVVTGLVVATFGVRRWAAIHLAVATLLCIALGATFAKLETVAAGTKMLGGEITTRLTGRVVISDHLANGRIRLTLDVLGTERPKLRYAPNRVRVSARSIPADARAGDVLTGAVRLMSPLGPTRPGAYDFSFESYFDGIGATGFFLTGPTIVPAIAPANLTDRFLAGVENTRDVLAARIRSQIGGAEGEIAAALITGVRAGIPEDVNEALRRTGLAHVLSISGLHMALVAASIMGAMRLGFACFQDFSARHPVRKYAALVALAALAAYLFISGYQVAAQRSFIMIAIMLVALLFDHAALTMRNLALAAIVVIAVSPHEVVGPSFQMSFAATAALIGAYAAWSQRRTLRPSAARQQHFVLRGMRLSFLYATGLAMTSLLAGSATTIFGAYHFQRVSPLGLIANLAAMPVVSVLVMPFAVLGLLAMPFGLDGLPFAIMGEGLRIMIGITAWLSSRSPLDAVGMIAPTAVVLLTIALVLATLLTTWLRLAAVPFAVAGMGFCLFPPIPAIFVSEDARLIGIETSRGQLAVNRTRPNDFAVQNWMRAMAVERISKPLFIADESADLWAVSSKVSANDERFRCTKKGCIARGRRASIATTSDVSFARSLCGKAAVIVLDDATAGAVCDDETVVVTRRQLARRGSAALFAGNDAFASSETIPLAMTAYAGVAAASGGISPNSVMDEAIHRHESGSADPQERARHNATAYPYRIVFSAAEPYRPWHDHRRFSREARGLAPWKPDPSKARKRDAADKKPSVQIRQNTTTEANKTLDPQTAGQTPSP